MQIIRNWLEKTKNTVLDVKESFDKSRAKTLQAEAQLHSRYVRYLETQEAAPADHIGRVVRLREVARHRRVIDSLERRISRIEVKYVEN